LRIWQQPIKGRQYVIGADTGEGLADGDASCACVLDRVTGEQVAELHGRVAPDIFGHQLAALGRFYNYALLGVERNNHGHSTLNTLRNTIHYNRLYKHHDYDDQSGKKKTILGWPTTSKTRTPMVDDFCAAVANGDCLIHSAGLIDECFTFVVLGSNDTGAQEGSHDDRVIAAAFAWQLRNNMSSNKLGNMEGLIGESIWKEAGEIPIDTPAPMPEPTTQKQKEAQPGRRRLRLGI
jgi:hypothetical protein